jgi:hypothetical protein
MILLTKYQREERSSVIIAHALHLPGTATKEVAIELASIRIAFFEVTLSSRLGDFVPTAGMT